MTFIAAYVEDKLLEAKPMFVLYLYLKKQVESSLLRLIDKESILAGAEASNQAKQKRMSEENELRLDAI